MTSTGRASWTGRLDPDTWPLWVRAVAVVVLILGALLLLLLGPQRPNQLLH
ncbi:MAG TPA: hypothetical protein VIB48_21370 [Acidimicrobiia bacterium]